MDLHIHISTTKALSFHVHTHLQHITTQEQSNTVKCLHPESDIMEWLEEYVFDEILELKTHILDTLPEEEIVHFWNVTLQGFKAEIYKLLMYIHLRTVHVLLNTSLYLNKLDKLVVQNTA